MTNVRGFFASAAFGIVVARGDAHLRARAKQSSEGVGQFGSDAVVSMRRRPRSSPMRKSRSSENRAEPYTRLRQVPPWKRISSLGPVATGLDGRLDRRMLQSLGEVKLLLLVNAILHDLSLFG